MTYELFGNWKGGLAFDLHTVGSVYLGVDQYGHNRFENTRSDMGELVFQLKYCSDETAVPKIIDLLTSLEIEGFDAIIPVPSSKARALQPVDAIARAFGNQRGVSVLVGYLIKEGSAELKSIDDPVERANALGSGIKIAGKENISGKKGAIIRRLI